jgi:cyclohexadieny/prephenate dehydrogenase
MTNVPIYDHIAIIGVGLIGSSVALAAKQNDATKRITLYDQSQVVREKAAELALGKLCDSAGQAVSGADLVILCVPPGQMGGVGSQIAAHLKAGATVTDVGSVKVAIVDQLLPVLPQSVHLVPGHPIAGTERSGPDAGFASLFKKRWTILTPLADQSEAYDIAVAALQSFWEALGSDVELMEPARHDMVLAMTSHLPHLIAFCVVATAEDVESVTDSEVIKYSAVLDLLGRFSEDLTALRRAIRWGDGDTLFSTFERARRMRREVIEAGQDSDAPNFGRDKGD